MNNFHRLVMAIIALSITMLVADAEAATLNVPSPEYSTIQDAIDEAEDGDEVLVSASGGPYVENINLSGNTKTITVKTTDGAVIDGNKSGSVVSFTAGSSSTLDGFTIKNGSATNGGGIYCDSSSPTITNCTITGNSATGASGDVSGGGIYCSSSSPTITNCTISGNSAFPGLGSGGVGSGGGIYCDSTATITNLPSPGMGRLMAAGFIAPAPPRSPLPIAPFAGIRCQ
jgi:nitrous oxidase accessory protein NosD